MVRYATSREYSKYEEMKSYRVCRNMRRCNLEINPEELQS